MPASKILIADDNPTNVELLEAYLSGLECEIMVAVDGRDTLDKVASFQPDLILLDIMFAGPPGPDGIEVSRQIHQDPALGDIPVIVLSGVKKVLDMPVKIGPDEDYMPVKAFLEKPFKPDELLSEVEKVLGPRQ